MNIDVSNYYWKNDLITLRQPREEDCADLVHHMFESKGLFFFNEEIAMPTDPEQYRKWFIESLEPGKADYICFVIENSEGSLAGIANLFHIDERNGTFGPIGIMINPAARGNGYAAAALRMLGKYMFEERRMHKWNSCYVEGNKNSAALHRMLGFEIEGIRKDMFYHEGRYWNQVLCGMTGQRFFENEAYLSR